MYFYILDPHNIPQKNFERQQTELQGLLTEFNIGGEMTRITPLRLMHELVDTAASRGVKTLVACGSDETFNQLLAAVKGRDFTLAFIPFTNDAQLGKIFGMTDLLTCVKTIAGRRTEKIDLAKIGDTFFISSLELGIATKANKTLGFFSSLKLLSGFPTEIKMRIDNSYTIVSKTLGGLLINTRGTKIYEKSLIGDPQDGYLDLLLVEPLSKINAARYKKDIESGCYEKIPNTTKIRCKKVEFLEPANYKIFVDGIEVAKIPAEAELLPNSLKMIVGKNRTFNNE